MTIQDDRSCFPILSTILVRQVLNMGKYVDFYCNDNNRKLKKIIDPILTQEFRWIAQKDYDDFYSLGALVVWDCEKKFENRQIGDRQFRSFLSSCLRKKIKSRLTYMNREKRVFKDDDGNPVYEVSIDALIGDGDKETLGDLIPGRFYPDQLCCWDGEEVYSDKMLRYLGRLSMQQKQVLKLIVAGFVPDEIMERLHIERRQYAECRAAIRAYRNVSVLY